MGIDIAVNLTEPQHVFWAVLILLLVGWFALTQHRLEKEMSIERQNKINEQRNDVVDSDLPSAL